MKTLDLGCSSFTRPHPMYPNAERWGIDLVAHPESDKQIVGCDLAIDPIPFGDNEFDGVSAFDFLEHLPMVLYIPMHTMKHSYEYSQDYNFKQEEIRPTRRDVMISLFNEVYRVLKPGGIFYSQTPIYPDKSIFQDPTHLSVWTDDSMNYFSGDYFGFHDHYNHKSRFEQMEKRIQNNHAYVWLKARKDIPDGTEYKIHYL